VKEKQDMIDNTSPEDIASRFPLSSLNEQADLVEQHGVDTLLFYPNAWALRHVFINQNTGEIVRARCNRWDCLFCGPRKVDQWRQLVKAAEPTLFHTLTKAGKTVEGAGWGFYNTYYAPMKHSPVKLSRSEASRTR
jgi:hypothetical protein